MTFFDFLSNIVGTYVPLVLEDGTVAINWQYVAGYVLVIICFWWMFHLINNIFFSRKR